MNSLNSDVLVVSGENKFSAKIARAKAVTISSKGEAIRGIKDHSFVIETGRETYWLEFVTWCQSMTRAPQNGVFLQVECS